MNEKNEILKLWYEIHYLRILFGYSLNSTGNLETFTPDILNGAREAALALVFNQHGVNLSGADLEPEKDNILKQE